MLDTTEIVEAAQISADSIGADLVRALIDELNTAPGHWTQLDELAQAAAIDRLRRRVRVNVEAALTVIFGGQVSAVPASLDSVVVKSGIRASLSIAAGVPSRHDLIDNVGTRVVLVMVDPEDYMAGADAIRAKASQGDLFEASGNCETSETSATAALTTAPATVHGLGGCDPDRAASRDALADRLSVDQNIAVWHADARAWTDPEARVVADWLNNPDTTVRPHWLPLPGSGRSSELEFSTQLEATR